MQTAETLSGKPVNFQLKGISEHWAYSLQKPYTNGVTCYFTDITENGFVILAKMEFDGVNDNFKEEMFFDDFLDVCLKQVGKSKEQIKSNESQVFVSFDDGMEIEKEFHIRF